MSKIEVREEQKRAAAFLLTCGVVLTANNWVSAQALDLNFLTVMQTTAESVADHPIWATILALLAVGCLIMYGVTKHVQYLFALIIPVIMAGAVINWRSLMQSFISGLRL